MDKKKWSGKFNSSGQFVIQVAIKTLASKTKEKERM